MLGWMKRKVELAVPAPPAPVKHAREYSHHSQHHPIYIHSSLPTNSPSPLRMSRPTTPSPISTLPNEILCQIFEAFLELFQDPASRFRCPAALSGVCKRWQTVAVDLPSLWDTIYIDLNPKVHKLDIHVSARLSRSKSRGLDIEVRLNSGFNHTAGRYNPPGHGLSPDQYLMIQRCLQSITGATERIRRLVFKAQGADHDLRIAERAYLGQFFELINTRRSWFPRLEEMVLGKVRLERFNAIIQRAPRLHRLALLEQRLAPSDFEGMTLSYGSKLASLRHLHVQCSSWRSEDWQHIHTMLANCHMLKSLHIGSSPPKEFVARDPQNRVVVKPLLLEKLVDLRLVDLDWDFMVGILQSINPPNLETLVLRLRESFRLMSSDSMDRADMFHSCVTLPKLTRVAMDLGYNNAHAVSQLSARASNVSHLTISSTNLFSGFGFLAEKGIDGNLPFPQLTTLNVGGGRQSLIPSLRSVVRLRYNPHPEAINIRDVHISGSMLENVRTATYNELARECLKWLTSHVTIKSFDDEEPWTVKEDHTVFDDMIPRKM